MAHYFDWFSIIWHFSAKYFLFRVNEGKTTCHSLELGLCSTCVEFSVTKIQIFKFRKVKCSSVWRYDKNISICCQKRAFISSIGAHRGLHSDAFGSYLFQSTICSEIFDVFIVNVFEKLIDISCLLKSLLN